MWFTSTHLGQLLAPVARRGNTKPLQDKRVAISVQLVSINQALARLLAQSVESELTPLSECHPVYLVLLGSIKAQQIPVAAIYAHQAHINQVVDKLVVLIVEQVRTLQSLALL